MTLLPIATVSYDVHEGAGTGSNVTDNITVIYTGKDGVKKEVGSSGQFESYGTVVSFWATYLPSYGEYEDDIVDYQVRYSPYLSPLFGPGFSGSVHLGDNTSDAVTYYEFSLIPGIPSNSGSIGGKRLPDVDKNMPGSNPLPLPPWMQNGLNWAYNQYDSLMGYSQYRNVRDKALSSDGAFSFFNPEDLYFGSQYYGQSIGSSIGSLFGDSGLYIGGKIGRFGGDVVGSIASGFAEVIEGFGTALAYGVSDAIDNPSSGIVNVGKTVINEGVTQIANVVDMGANTLSLGGYLINKAVKSVYYGATAEPLNDNDINTAIDLGAGATSVVLSLKAGKSIKIKDVSISKIDSLGANAKYSKVTYGVGLYVKNSPKISITKDGVYIGGAPFKKLKDGQIYTAIDEYEIPHLKATMQNIGVNGDRFSSGLNIAKTTYGSKQGVFTPEKMEIFSENIPDSAKPAVYESLKEYANRVGDVEIYGSNIQKLQIRDYQTRSVGDIEIAVKNPNEFVNILDKNLKKHGINNYEIKNSDSDSPKVYFGEDKGIEIFKHDNTPMAIIEKSLNPYESDFTYGFNNLPMEKLEEFNIMQLPEQHARKFSGGHVLRQNENGNWDILPTHEGRYKDITDFIDIAVAYYNEKRIGNPQDIINYVKSTPDYIAEKVSSPTFHYIRKYEKIPTLDEIKILTSMNDDKSLKNGLYGFEDISNKKIGMDINKQYGEKELLLKITKEDNKSSLKRNSFSSFINRIDSNDISTFGSIGMSRNNPYINNNFSNISNNYEKTDNSYNINNKNNYINSYIKNNPKYSKLHSNNNPNYPNDLNYPKPSDYPKPYLKDELYPSIKPNSNSNKYLNTNKRPNPYPPDYPKPYLKDEPYPDKYPKPNPNNYPNPKPSDYPKPNPNISSPIINSMPHVPSIPRPYFPRNPQPSKNKNKKRDKDKELFPKVIKPLYVKPPSVKKNKRKWELRDLLNPGKMFKDVDDSIKNINKNIKI